MAAGLGFKEFTTGDVLTAADANGYLASQVVMVFADAAARTSAIASPEEGMISYLKDTNSTEYYSGSAWVAIGGGGASSTIAAFSDQKSANTQGGTFTSRRLAYSRYKHNSRHKRHFRGVYCFRPNHLACRYLSHSRLSTSLRRKPAHDSSLQHYRFKCGHQWWFCLHRRYRYCGYTFPI
jgi:hypothetical protein